MMTIPHSSLFSVKKWGKRGKGAGLYWKFSTNFSTFLYWIFVLTAFSADFRAKTGQKMPDLRGFTAGKRETPALDAECRKGAVLALGLQIVSIFPPIGRLGTKEGDPEAAPWPYLHSRPVSKIL